MLGPRRPTIDHHRSNSVHMAMGAAPMVIPPGQARGPDQIKGSASGPHPTLLRYRVLVVGTTRCLPRGNVRTPHETISAGALVSTHSGSIPGTRWASNATLCPSKPGTGYDLHAVQLTPSWTTASARQTRVSGASFGGRCRKQIARAQPPACGCLCYVCAREKRLIRC